jgi:hypothetical protein
VDGRCKIPSILARPRLRVSTRVQQIEVSQQFAKYLVAESVLVGEFDGGGQLKTRL